MNQYATRGLLQAAIPGAQMATSHLDSTTQASISVRAIETQDGTVLLDIDQGLCLAMNATATRVWNFLKMNQSIEEIVDRLTEEFREVSKEQIRDDVVQFTNSLKAHGLLRPSGEFRHRPSVYKTSVRRYITPWLRQPDFMKNRFLFWKALLGLFVFDLFQLGANFTRIYAFVRQWPIAAKTSPEQAIQQISRSINQACVWYPKRVLCLQRSAITTCLLRSCGVKAQMVLGAQQIPFKAHAWTEVAGNPVNERRDVRQAYLVWDRC
jgi:hypothetical protein